MSAAMKPHHIQHVGIAPREGQPCYCPDEFLDNHINVDYCPAHGSTPDPELWDYNGGTEYDVTDKVSDAPIGAVIEAPEFGPGLWVRRPDVWRQASEADIAAARDLAGGEVT